MDCPRDCLYTLYIVELMRVETGFAPTNHYGLSTNEGRYTADQDVYACRHLSGIQCF